MIHSALNITRRKKLDLKKTLKLEIYLNGIKIRCFLAMHFQKFIISDYIKIIY